MYERYCVSIYYGLSAAVEKMKENVWVSCWNAIGECLEDPGKRSRICSVLSKTKCFLFNQNQRNHSSIFFSPNTICRPVWKSTCFKFVVCFPTYAVLGYSAPKNSHFLSGTALSKKAAVVKSWTILDCSIVLAALSLNISCTFSSSECFCSRWCKCSVAPNVFATSIFCPLLQLLIFGPFLRKRHWK